MNPRASATTTLALGVAQVAPNAVRFSPPDVVQEPLVAPASADISGQAAPKVATGDVTMVDWPGTKPPGGGFVSAEKPDGLANAGLERTTVVMPAEKFHVFHR
jgi:hypothetical protein